MKVLAVEDDPVLLRVLADTLRKLGHEVVTAGDGERAWQILQEEPIRVVVSDWMMPLLDGLQLCQRVRAADSADYTYFILLTVQDSSTENKQRAADAGVDDFLTKPLNPSELWLRLRVAERIVSFARRVRDLERLLPICSYCKNVRDDLHYWRQIESYFQTHGGAKFTHSICPDCYGKFVLPQIESAAAPAADQPDSVPPR